MNNIMDRDDYTREARVHEPKLRNPDVNLPLAEAFNFDDLASERVILILLSDCHHFLLDQMVECVPI